MTLTSKLHELQEEQLGLVFDERDKLQEQPGLHVLIAGVSAYRHLPGGTGKQAPESFEMRQLNSTALTAYKIFCWLKKWRKNLPVPLATVRLLVSPSLKEACIQPKLKDLTPCTYHNFLTALKYWREDASANPLNRTLFYFAGHGIKTTTCETTVLLTEDFGDGMGSLLSKAVDFQNLYRGMAVSKARKNMASTQLYFVDACRNLPWKLKSYQPMEASKVFDIYLDEGFPDKRCAPIFYATVSGGYAEGIKGKQTLFSKALLKLLKGYGGQVAKEFDNEVQWHISVHSLLTQLQPYIDELKQVYPEVEQRFEVDKLSGEDTTIIFLDGVPKTDLILEFKPSSALEHTQLQIKNGHKTIHKLKAPIRTHPCRLPIPYTSKSKCKIIAKVEPPHPDFLGKSQELVRLKRPFHLLLLKMTP
jgi:hypothetical protein